MERNGSGGWLYSYSVIIITFFSESLEGFKI